jgi:hypothetical protein
VSLNEEIDKLKSDKTKYSEQNFMQLQKNYEQHCRTSKHRIDSLVHTVLLIFVGLTKHAGTTTSIYFKRLEHTA